MGMRDCLLIHVTVCVSLSVQTGRLIWEFVFFFLIFSCVRFLKERGGGFGFVSAGSA